MVRRRALLPFAIVGLVVTGCRWAAHGAPPSASPVVSPVAADAAVARLHGHNDYLQPVPLRTALALGLGSVEADVFLEDGELRVGHERWQLRPGRTLCAMYLEPLRAFAAAHGGRVRADGAPFVLLVDIKADAEAVYRRLREELAAHRTILTRFAAKGVEPGAVTVILSGARPRALVEAEPSRWCALDGRLADLDAVPLPPVTLMPWISDAWQRVSDGNGADGLLPAEQARIRDLVARAHAQGRELRFWGAPDRESMWLELRRLGVDRIGTDRPKAAAACLRSAAVE